jgi:prepilin-type N-terminal cleavage/methylation domain-containing protein
MSTTRIRPTRRSTPPPHIHGTKEKRNEMFGTSTITSQRVDRHDDKGFTLIEILIAIVLIGVLSAVAVVGIGNMLSTGSTSACEASKDASKAASAVYFASHSNVYPVDFEELTTADVGPPAIPASLELPDSVTPPAVGDLTVTSGSSWDLTMDITDTPPTFLCGTP